MKKTLEIEPLTKNLTVIIIQKEYEEPLWEYDFVLFPKSSPPLERIQRPSVAFREFLWEIVTKFKPDFVTEELGMRKGKNFHEKNIVAQLCDERNIRYHPTDIDENAKNYLAYAIEKKKNQRDEFLQLLAKVSKKEDMGKIEYLHSYCQHLQEELEEEIKKVSFEVRESWICMGILDQAKRTDKNEVVGVHISSPRHVKGITKLLKSLNAEAIPVKLEKRVASTPEAKSFRKGLSKNLKPLEALIVPVIKSETELPYILFFLDTDKQASAFDISMAYDAGFNVVVPYEGITPEDAKTIVQDAIFPRGPSGIKLSSFLIGGKDLRKAEKILDVIKQTMFFPFETSVIIDPRGAYTTAAAMVAQVERGVGQIDPGDRKGRKIVVLAGTGPVGMVASALCAQLGYDVFTSSRSKKRAEETAEEILKRWKVQVKGVQVSNHNEALEAVKDASVILATGAPGVELISKETVVNLKGKKLIIDVNTIPPFSVAGLLPKHDLEEIYPDIYGIGALVVGNLKNRIERNMLTAARKAGKGVFDHNYAFKQAMEILEKSEQKPPRISFEELKLPPLTINARI